MGKKEEAAAKAQQEAAKAAAKEAAKSVLVTTGDALVKYQPLNVVFAVGGSTGLAASASAIEAFEKARAQLQLGAAMLGGNAVVFARFGHSMFATSGCGSTSFTVHGYGTVVRFV